MSTNNRTICSDHPHFLLDPVSATNSNYLFFYNGRGDARRKSMHNIIQQIWCGPGMLLVHSKNREDKCHECHVQPPTCTEERKRKLKMRIIATISCHGWRISVRIRSLLPLVISVWFLSFSYKWLPRAGIYQALGDLPSRGNSGKAKWFVAARPPGHLFQWQFPTDWPEDLRRRIWSCTVVCDFGIETKMLLYSSIREVNGMKLCVPTESEDYNIYNPGYAKKKKNTGKSH